MFHSKSKIITYLLVINCFCVVYLHSVQQQIKKIVADITEYNRKDRLIKFSNNVKIELKNGKIFCDRAVYNENNKNISCESNVYAIMVSTEDNSSIEIFSSFARYRQAEMELEFYGDPYAVYKSSDGVQKNILKANKFLLEEKKDKIVCKENVWLKNSDGEIFCNIAEYFISEKIIYMNYVPLVAPNNKVIFNSKKEKLNIKTFSSNNAVFYINENKVQLNGDVEIIFQSDNDL
ncbi:MAG: hypothetical protein SNJ64_00815 [Endomicrobiia bacterium]